MKIDRTYRKSIIPPHAKCVFEGVIFDVYQWEQELYDGTKTTFERLVGNDIAKVIPVLADGRIVIIDDEQPARPILTKIPGGYVDAGETPEDAAKRELLEECGYATGTLAPLIEVTPWNKVDYKRYYYIAHGCERVQDPLTQAGERITVRLVSFDEFITIAASGVLDDHALTEHVLRAQNNPATMAELKKIFRQS